jgi:hypothetical protein
MSGPTDATTAKPRRRDCEACGLVGGGRVHIGTTNGSLFLCQQCLDDINRKNPALAAARLAALTAAGDDADFLAFMADELDRFPCLHGPAGNGAHAKTPPMMWPELIRCIVAKARQDARPAPDAPPPVPAGVAAAAERIQRHKTAMATVGPTQSPYWQGHGWIGRPPGEVADLATVADYAVAELVARHVLP